jgi:hypothetical protein
MALARAVRLVAGIVVAIIYSLVGGFIASFAARGAAAAYERRRGFGRTRPVV